jgi:DNA-directed RNA polymerase subunit RPC12/RpoP
MRGDTRGRTRGLRGRGPKPPAVELVCPDCLAGYRERQKEIAAPLLDMVLADCGDRYPESEWSYFRCTYCGAVWVQRRGSRQRVVIGNHRPTWSKLAEPRTRE